jgi:hypothetical protein
MSGWVRLGVLISAIWMVGVLSVAALEYTSIPNGACVNSNASAHMSDYSGRFFYCDGDPFADIMLSGYWRDVAISDGQEIVIFHLYEFLKILLLPIVIVLMFSSAMFYSIRWVYRGFSKKKF